MTPVGAAGRGVVGAAVVAGLYQVVTMLGLADSSLLPSVPAILRETAHLSIDPAFLAAVGSTMTAVTLGLVISCAIGVTAGFLVGMSAAGARLTTAPIDILRSIPSVALIPLFLMTLGDGTLMKTVVVVVVSVWPILLNVTYGVRSVDRMAVDAARSLGAGGSRIWLRVLVPSTFPAVATGFRVSLPMALTVAISAEIAGGSPSGIGGFILNASYRDFDAAPVFAAVVLAGLIGWALNEVTAALADRLMPWEGRR